MFLPKICIAQKLWSCQRIGTTEIWPGACYLLAAWWQNLRPVITYCRSYGFRRHNLLCRPRGHSTTTWTKFYSIFTPYPLEWTIVDNYGHFTNNLSFLHVTKRRILLTTYVPKLTTYLFLSKQLLNDAHLHCLPRQLAYYGIVSSDQDICIQIAFNI